MTEIALSDVEIGDELGSGGQAEVYRGRWKTQDVAVKIVTGKIRDEEVFIYLHSNQP